MTLGKARTAISILWIATSTPLILLFIIQGILDKYGDEWDVPWNWFIPLVGPILTLIVAGWITDPNFEAAQEIKSRSLFYITTLLSLIYILALYSVVFLSPLSSQAAKELFRNSGWYLGVIQVFVVLTLHRFLIVNVEDR
jgi:hypothetical protein